MGLQNKNGVDYVAKEKKPPNKYGTKRIIDPKPKKKVSSQFLLVALLCCGI